jgi:hypothetical protein
MILNVKAGFVFSDSVLVNNDKKEVCFINGYWCEKVKYKGEEKERFKYLLVDSELRKYYEEVFKYYELDKSIVRFMNVGENELVMKFYGLKLLDNKKEVKWIQEEKKILKVKRKKKVEKVVVSKIEEVESLIDEMGGVKEKMVKNKKRGRVKTNKDKVDRADYLVVFEKGKVKKKK